MYFQFLILVLSVCCHYAVLGATHHGNLPQFATHGRSFVLVGGNSQDSQPASRGGRGVAKLGIITASSADPADSYSYYRDAFLEAGAKEVNWIPISEANKSLNTDSAIVNLIEEQTGFVFGGGDQSRVINSFFLAGRIASPALVAIRETFDRGAVVYGNSAGTVCHSSAVMVAGGMSYDALENGAHTSEKHRDDLVYDEYGGIGLLNGYVLDTHFSERGREGRLIRLLSDTRHHQHGVTWGIGIDENTTIVITHAGTTNAVGEVMGPNGVTLIDVSRSVVDHTAKHFAIRDVYMDYLTAGDRVNMHTHQVTFASDKTPLKTHEYYSHALTSYNVFYGTRANPAKKSEFVRIATSVFDAQHDRISHGYTHEKNPRFHVTLSRTGSDAEGYIKRGHSFEEDAISFKNLCMEIMEEEHGHIVGR